MTYLVQYGARLNAPTNLRFLVRATSMTEVWELVEDFIRAKGRPYQESFVAFEKTLDGVVLTGEPVVQIA